MKTIGGYFELALANKGEYYPCLLSLNTARNCLEYILLANNYRKVFIPYYICDVVIDSIKKINIDYEFYSLNEDLSPSGDIVIKDDEAFLYVNYFGLKDNIVSKFSRTIKNLIIDNSQAFFSKPLKYIDTIYSPRKFFGIPDGGYLSTRNYIKDELMVDSSIDRINHLLIRIEKNAEIGYPVFKENEKILSGQSIKRMSKLTKRILNSIDYEEVKDIREKNFRYLHKHLGSINKLEICIDNIQGPMVYPLYLNKEGIREYLIKNKIYVAIYWPNVFDYCKKESLEFDLAKNIIPLPIDQRYSISDMEIILNALFAIV